MKIPFAVSKRPNYVPIGDPEFKQIYLKKIGARTNRERTLVDSLTLEETRFQLALLRLSQRIAEAIDITPEEAMTLLQDAPDELGEVTLQFIDDIDQIHERRAAILTHRDQVVAAMIQGRVAYPVVVRGVREATIEVEPLSFDLNPGHRLSFGSTLVSVSEAAAVGECEILIDKTVILKPGDVGFLLDPLTNQVRCGDPSFTIADFESEDEYLIDAIFKFYQEELTGDIAPEKKEPSRRQSKSSKNSVKAVLPIGPDSTSDANPTESNTSPEIISGNAPMS